MDPQRIAELEFGCRYSIAYVGWCNRPRQLSGFCSTHSQTRCSSCKAQATHDCSYTGQFVCGSPLCDDCEGWEDRSKASGSWGFMNHSHRRIPGREIVREAVAAEFGLPDETL